MCILTAGKGAEAVSSLLCVDGKDSEVPWADTCRITESDLVLSS